MSSEERPFSEWSWDCINQQQANMPEADLPRVVLVVPDTHIRKGHSAHRLEGNGDLVLTNSELSNRPTRLKE